LQYRTDNRKEFKNSETNTYLKQHGITHELSVPDSQAQNRIPEHRNHTNLEGARSMIFAKDLPEKLWPEAVSYMAYIRNRSPTCVLGGKTLPFKALFSKKLNISHSCKFGTKCWVMIPAEQQRKLDPKAKENIFVGVVKFSKAWKYFNIETGAIQISQNITFSETDTKLYPIPGESNDNNDNDIPVLIEGEQMYCYQGEQTKEVSIEEVAQPQEKEAEGEAASQPSDCYEATTTEETACGSGRLAGQPRKNYAEMNDPW